MKLLPLLSLVTICAWLEALVRWARIGDSSHVLLLVAFPFFFRVLSRGVRVLSTGGGPPSERDGKEGVPSRH
jgi:hypothetical protein